MVASVLDTLAIFRLTSNVSPSLLCSRTVSSPCSSPVAISSRKSLMVVALCWAQLRPLRWKVGGAQLQPRLPTWSSAPLQQRLQLCDHVWSSCAQEASPSWRGWRRGGPGGNQVPRVPEDTDYLCHREHQLSIRWVTHREIPGLTEAYYVLCLCRVSSKVSCANGWGRQLSLQVHWGSHVPFCVLNCASFPYIPRSLSFLPFSPPLLFRLLQRELWWWWRGKGHAPSWNPSCSTRTMMSSLYFQYVTQNIVPWSIEARRVVDAR